MNKDEAFEAQERYTGKAHGSIQWNDAKVCIDITCDCGKQYHLDDYFMYYVKCLDCGAVYFCNGHIELIKLDEEPEYCVIEMS